MMVNGIKKIKNVCDIKVLVLLLVVAILVSLTVLQFLSIKDVYDRSALMLIEDVLTAEKQPSTIANNNIFFHKSGFSMPMSSLFLTFFGFLQPDMVKIYSAHLMPHEACAIESAALHNPDSEIFVIFMDQSNWMHSKQSSLLTTLLAAYPNVNVRTVHFRNYLKNTPVMKWLDNQYIKFNLVESESMQLLRFLSIWHYGGTCLDFDTIVLRNLDELGSNYIVANEKTNQMTISILKLIPIDVGRAFANKYMANYLHFFNEEGNPDNYNERTLYQVAKSILCDQNITEMVQQRNCSDVKIYGNAEFFDVSLPPQTANEKRSALSEMFTNRKDWYAVYSRGRFWNETKYESIVRGPKTYLSMKHCPKVYKQAKENQN